MKKSKILVLGGDIRQTYCVSLLKDAGHDVCCFLVPGYPSPNISVDILKNYLSDTGYILCPVPFSRDKVNITTYGEYDGVKLQIELLASLINENQTIICGSIQSPASEILTKRDIPYYDITAFKSFKEANGLLTAEGLLKDIIEFTPFSIPEANILIAGYGCCGRHIASKLSSLGGHITIYNRNKSFDCIARTNGFSTMNTLPEDNLLKNYNIIINTVPSVIFNKSVLSHINPETYLFDIANGFDTEYIRKNKFVYKHCPGIPGKTSPMSAARIICHILNEEI